MNELALFAGAGGGILGGKLLGWNTVGAVEIDKYARKVLLHQQNQGNLPFFPIWDDVCTFDGKPWRGLVDVVSGGFPCQDISAAGKGAGIEGTRSGLWAEMFRIICEVRPRFAFMENSPMLTSRGLGRVLGDLAKAGYNACWLVLGAADVGAPHRRDRIWILAEDSQQRGLLSHPQHNRAGWGEQITQASSKKNAAFNADTDLLQCTQQRLEHERPEISAGSGEDRVESGGDVADTGSERLQARWNAAGNDTNPAIQGQADRSTGDGEAADAANSSSAQCAGIRDSEQLEPSHSGAGYDGSSRAARGAWWTFEPNVGRVADGVASRVDRLKCLGNGQVPLVAATAFQRLRKRLIAITD